MPTLRVPSAYATLQDALNAAAASGDTIILEDGTHGAGGGLQVADFRSGITGTVFTSLDINADNDYLAIIDFTGAQFRGMRCAGTGVRWQGVIFSGQPDLGQVWQDTDNALDGWAWVGCKVRSSTAQHWWLYNLAGSSMRWEEIVAESSYLGARIIEVRAPGSANLDMLLRDIDGSFHPEGGAMVNAVHLRDVRDARLYDIKASNTSSYGIHIDSRTVGRGCRDITIRNPVVRNSGGVGIHAGDLSSGQPPGSFVETERVRVINPDIDGTSSYGIEYENGPTECEVQGGVIKNAPIYGIVLAEESQGCRIHGTVIHGMEAMSAHIYMKNAVRAVITDTEHQGFGTEAAIRIADDGAPTLDNQRHIVANCEGRNLGYIYDLVTVPAAGNEHAFCQNRWEAPLIAFARIGAATDITKSAWEITYASSIDEPDTIVDTIGSLQYSQEADARLYAPQAPASEEFSGYIQKADAIINAILRAQYVVPFTTVPDLIIQISAKLAAAEFLKAHYAKINKEPPKQSNLLYKEAMDMLAMIKKNPNLLGIDLKPRDTDDEKLNAILISDDDDSVFSMEDEGAWG